MDIPPPEPAEQQAKSVDGTARSFFKGGMGVALQNFQRMTNIGHRNATRLLNKADGKAGTESGSQVSDDMRIDSDDIHNHYHQQREGMSSLAKLAALAMVATPLGIAAWNLPAIVGVLSAGAAPAVKPPVKVEPKDETEPEPKPSVQLNGRRYKLRLKPE